MRAAWLLLVGCGRLAFDPRSDGGGALDDSLSGLDAEVDAPPGAMVVTFGETSSAGVTGVTTDAVLDAVNLTGNYGGRPTLDLDSRYTPLVRFDISSIPTTATVLDARLTLHTTDDPSPNDVSVHRLLEAWTEGVLDGGIGAANYFQRQTGTSWASPGATGLSRVAGSSGGFQASLANATYTFAITAAVVQLWVSTPTDNHGLVFESGGTDLLVLHSSESTSVDRRPTLRVTYMP